MRIRRHLLSALALMGPALSLISCSSEPTLPAVSITEIETEGSKFEDFSLFYSPGRGGYLVGDYKGSLSQIAIPDNATNEDGITAPIVGLADNAFYGRKGITTVFLGENINFIGSNAFYGTDITDLRVAGSLTEVADDAFEESKITFYEKDGIEYLPSWDRPYVTAFTDGKDVSDKLVSTCRHAVVKAGAKGINGGAFEHCKALISVAIPSSVTYIGAGAFEGCTSLSSIRIPSSVTRILIDAFEDCPALEDTYISFANTTKFLNMTGKEYLTGSVHFLDKDHQEVRSIEIPSTITSIQDRAFYNCRSLCSIEIPSSVTSIGDFAFASCTSLGSIEIPSSVTAIGASAFTNCTSLYIYPEAESRPSGWDKDWNSYDRPVSWGAKGSWSSEIRYHFIDTEEGKSATILRVSGNIKDARIPTQVDGYPVTAIASGAFSGRYGLKSVEIPSSMVSIGDNAFSGCTALKSVNIPASVTSIGESVFSLCRNLTSITVDAENRYFDSRESCNAIVKTEDNSLIQGCASTTIPSSVASIAKRAFYGCTSLKSIQIPTSVINIDENAFENCTSLTSLELPSSMASVKENGFYQCSSLASLKLPASLNSIGDFAFGRCYALKAVQIPAKVSSIGHAPFAACRKLTSIVVDSNNFYYDSRNNCNAILETATNTIVQGCSATTIPSSTSIIGNFAFYGCAALKTLDIPGPVSTIRFGAFYGCSSLASVHLPHSVSLIEEFAFGSCVSLTDVYIKVALWWWFLGISGKQNLVGCVHLIDNEGREIKEIIDVNTPFGMFPNYAFYGCAALTSVRFNIRTYSLGAYAFYGCSSLTSIEIPAKLTSIGKYAFKNCTSLTIYCKAKSEPRGFATDWNGDTPVKWGA